jgi:hypothetical protein
MSINSNYLFVVKMDVDADKEALFNEIYDTEHIPNLLKVPGVRGVTRMAGEPFAMSIGGAEKKVAHDGPRYSAIYEIDGPHVLVSQEWANAVGLPPSHTRPPRSTAGNKLSRVSQNRAAVQAASLAALLSKFPCKSPNSRERLTPGLRHQGHAGGPLAFWWPIVHF